MTLKKFQQAVCGETVIVNRAEACIIRIYGYIFTTAPEDAARIPALLSTVLRNKYDADH